MMGRSKEEYLKAIRPIPTPDTPSIEEGHKAAGRRQYTLGLMEGGLMEDPAHHIEHIATVWAANLLEAKNEWAKVTGHTNPEYWNSEQGTYWGWPVVEIGYTCRGRCG